MGITVEVRQIGGKLPANQILFSVSSRVLTAFGGGVEASGSGCHLGQPHCRVISRWHPGVRQ